MKFFRSKTSGIARRQSFLFLWGAFAALSLPPVIGQATEYGLRGQALAALQKAVEFYHDRVATHGGYAYFYTPDLRRRWGEGEGTASQVWVQPPGTPAVGMAYLKAYEATGERECLEAALDAARALVYGQLQSGGWTQTVDFDPQGSRVAQYRNGKGKGRNNSTLDDDQSQSAIRFLVRLDKALDFKEPEVHDTVEIAFDALLKAQYPNGAFPQVWTGPVAAHPVMKANYPAEWSRIWPGGDYWNFYTLNDGLAETVSDTLFAALDAYPQEPRYRQALERLGDFLILAQMPEPQPAWAQQYDFQMHPAWARKFEPPAMSGWESQGIIRTLIRIYRLTGARKYLEPVPRALAYLKKSQLPDGRMARYYELQTNRPLYMNRTDPKHYYLTYDDKDLPSHYGWKQPSLLDDLQSEYDGAVSGQPKNEPAPDIAQLEPKVGEIIRSLDDQGAWISTYAGERLVGQPKFKPGFRFIDMSVFNRNVELLSDYLIATRLKAE